MMPVCLTSVPERQHRNRRAPTLEFGEHHNLTTDGRISPWGLTAPITLGDPLMPQSTVLTITQICNRCLQGELLSYTALFARMTMASSPDSALSCQAPWH